MLGSMRSSVWSSRGFFAEGEVIFFEANEICEKEIRRPV